MITPSVFFFLFVCFTLNKENVHFVWLKLLFVIFFSSPEPKAPGELLVC